MMTSLNGNIFRVTGHLCGEFTGLQWMFFFDLRWTNRRVNNGEAGDLRRYRAHYDDIVMLYHSSTFKRRVFFSFHSLSWKKERSHATLPILLLSTHWPLWDLNKIINKKKNSSWFYWLMAEVTLVKLPSDQWHWALLMIRQHWFRQWLGAARQSDH